MRESLLVAELVFLLLTVIVQIRGLGQHGQNQNRTKERRKIAVLWVFTGEPVFYWKWTLATLLNAGADKVDVHLIMGVPPARLAQYQLEMVNYPLSHRAIFHSVMPDEWQSRIRDRLGINITYSLEGLGRKVADYKPCLGALFQDFLPVSQYAYWVYGDSDGFFGSYNTLIDYSVLPMYDVISGLPEPPKGSQAWNAVPGQWRPLHSTGGWTMLRNTPKINNLYTRAKNWPDMLGSKEYRSFDEETPPDMPKESFQAMLQNGAWDVRRCCENSRIPPVLKQLNDTHQLGTRHAIFIAGLDSRYIDDNNALQATWRQGQGLSVNVYGRIGQDNAQRNETAQVLFMHFLQFKYCCGTELYAAMKLFLKDYEQAGRSVLSLTCFRLDARSFRKFVFTTC